MADTLYQFTNIIGVENAPFTQTYPTWGVFNTQIQYDGENTPYLGFFDENNTVVYELLGTSLGNNLYKWSFDLSIYTNLYDKCLHAYIYTNQQNISTPEPIDVLAESESILVSVINNDVNQIEYSNNEIFDTIDYTNYTNYAYVFAQLGHDYNYEENTTVYEKSNGGIVKLSATLKDKRIFLTDYLPKYFHEKLSLAFMHDNLLIDGESFVKNSEYQLTPIDRFSLSQGSTTLSRSNYNYVNSNCL